MQYGVLTTCVMLLQVSCTAHQAMWCIDYLCQCVMLRQCHAEHTMQYGVLTTCVILLQVSCTAHQAMWWSAYLCDVTTVSCRAY